MVLVLSSMLALLYLAVCVLAIFVAINWYFYYINSDKLLDRQIELDTAQMTVESIESLSTINEDKLAMAKSKYEGAKKAYGLQTEHTKNYKAQFGKCAAGLITSACTIVVMYLIIGSL